MPPGAPVYALNKALAHPNAGAALNAASRRTKRLGARRIAGPNARNESAVRRIVQSEIYAQVDALVARHRVRLAPIEPAREPSLVSASTSVRQIANVCANKVLVELADQANWKRAADAVRKAAVLAARLARQFIDSPAVRDAAHAALRLISRRRDVMAVMGVTVVTKAVGWMSSLLPI